MNTYKERSLADKDDSLTSWYALARYKMAGFNPHVKFEMAEDKTHSATRETKTDITNLTVALEYVPLNDEVFRYHVAYTNHTEEPDTAGAQERRATNVYVGVRMLADVLK